MPNQPKPVAALCDVKAIDSYMTLQAEMVDLFTSMADGMSNRTDARPARIMRKMAATAETIPYDVLAEFGHSYNPALLAALLVLRVLRDDVPDYADAHDLVLALLDELRRINLDHSDTKKDIEEIKAVLMSMGRPSQYAPSDR